MIDLGKSINWKTEKLNLKIKNSKPYQPFTSKIKNTLKASFTVIESVNFFFNICQTIFLYVRVKKCHMKDKGRKIYLEKKIVCLFVPQICMVV